jgi:hypothetical protein
LPKKTPEDKFLDELPKGRRLLADELTRLLEANVENESALFYLGLLGEVVQLKVGGRGNIIYEGGKDFIQVTDEIAKSAQYKNHLQVAEVFLDNITSTTQITTILTKKFLHTLGTSELALYSDPRYPRHSGETFYDIFPPPVGETFSRYGAVFISKSELADLIKAEYATGQRIDLDERMTASTNQGKDNNLVSDPLSIGSGSAKVKAGGGKVATKQKSAVAQSDLDDLKDEADNVLDLFVENLCDEIEAFAQDPSFLSIDKVTYNSGFNRLGTTVQHLANYLFMYPLPNVRALGLIADIAGKTLSLLEEDEIKLNIKQMQKALEFGSALKKEVRNRGFDKKTLLRKEINERDPSKINEIRLLLRGIEGLAKGGEPFDSVPLTFYDWIFFLLNADYFAPVTLLMKVDLLLDGYGAKIRSSSVEPVVGEKLKRKLDRFSVIHSSALSSDAAGESKPEFNLQTFWCYWPVLVSGDGDEDLSRRTPIVVNYTFRRQGQASESLAIELVSCSKSDEYEFGRYSLEKVEGTDFPRLIFKKVDNNSDAVTVFASFFHDWFGSDSYYDDVGRQDWLRFSSDRNKLPYAPLFTTFV